MARALSNAGVFAALYEGVALLANRRGYSGAAAVMGAGRRGGTAEETAATFMRGRRGASADAEADAVAWLPDPVTGYYRPANRAGEMDAAGLREVLLNPKK
ncbi:Late embryogenesis abundant protein Lea5 [Ananas comosus]|uniref:Late embryogenesis abundant protein Lea5 n=1 Tax=Ananas comosus TaxID=4615 RepID=A0A199UKC7_ANACO|nr:Late embryogenesis abundant protein Lea5 [Ananas comosus]